MVSLGVPTSATPVDEAIIINYKAQTVYHHADRLRTLRPGLLTALTTGVMVIRDAPTELLAILTAGAVDYANASFTRNGHFEVLITTSMIAETEYLYRNSSIYYINDRDSWHYQVPAEPAVIELTAGLPAPAAEDNPEPDIELPLPIFPEANNPKSTEI